MKRVLLVGAGHAHARVLAALALKPLYGARMALVSPEPRQIYSAMLPGVIAGHYRREEAEFDVAELAARASVDYVPARIVSLDAANKTATLDDGQEVYYDFASLNAGSTIAQAAPGAADHTLAVKPFERLVDRLRRVSHVAIAGGGAAGIELAMALRHRGGEVTVYAERSGFAPPLARRIQRAVRRQGVDLRPGMRVDAVEPGPVVVSGSSRQQFDMVLWASGPAPQPWLAMSGLALDDRGFVRVNETLRSVSHPHIFAVGDCAGLGEAKSGVNAVRHGAVLEQNFRNLVANAPLASYQPDPNALLILTCGARYAIAARGSWSAEGRWAWWWKNWIDRRWLKRLRGELKGELSREASR
jgi:selenide, water dikinase